MDAQTTKANSLDVHLDRLDRRCRRLDNVKLAAVVRLENEVDDVLTILRRLERKVDDLDAHVRGVD